MAELPRQVIDDFISQAQRTLVELGKPLEALEQGDAPAENFMVFAQHVDALYQRSQLLLQSAGDQASPAIRAIHGLAEASRMLALKASALVQPDLVPVIAGCLVDSLDAIGDALNTLSPHSSSNETLPQQCHMVAHRVQELSAKIRVTPEDLEALLRRVST